MKHFFKELFFRLVPRTLSPDRAVILMYHSIADRPEHFNNVSPDSFVAQMAYLVKRKYPVISLTELTRRLESHSPLRSSVVITFDDGYRNNFTHAYPILKKYRFPVTVFVVTDLIGISDKRGLKHLSADELKEIQSSGLVSIEAHSRSHPKLAVLSTSEAREEIEGSKKTLEVLLGKSMRFFAYPYGAFNDETVRIVKEAGFKAAVSVKEGTIGQSADLFRLKRNSIDSSTTFAQFKGKISRAVDIYESLKIV